MKLCGHCLCIRPICIYDSIIVRFTAWIASVRNTLQRSDQSQRSGQKLGKGGYQGRHRMIYCQLTHYKTWHHGNRMFSYVEIMYLYVFKSLSLVTHKELKKTFYDDMSLWMCLKIGFRVLTTGSFSYRLNVTQSNLVLSEWSCIGLILWKAFRQLW